MKTIFLMITVVAITVANSSAQESTYEGRNKVRFGVKAGANYSNVYDTQGEEFRANAKVGVAAGIFLGLPIGKYFGIQPEILFSQKGFQATGKILGSTYDFTRTSDFIDVPLLLAIKPAGFLTILAGPQFSYLLQQKDVFATGATSIEQEREFGNDNIRKNLFGAVGGLDINLKHVVVGARAGWDLMNNNGDGTSTTPRYKNAWVQATLGYRF
jgi:hypothetical protein